MGLEVKFFVHGVSKGHKTWGAEDTDIKYANAFYSVNWPLKEMMMVEVRENNGSPYCYYSFIRGEKVLGADNRDGFYMAITLRMNACYTDLQNMYNILRAAYEKVSVGMYIQENGTYAQFTTDDFLSVEVQLAKLRDNIFDYISRFSRATDIVSLNGFQRGAGKAGLEVNASESNRGDVLATLKQTGKIFVSHLYPTTSEAKILATAQQNIAQCQAETQRSVQAIKDQAAQSIKQAEGRCAREKKELQDELNRERENSSAIKQEMRVECDRRIADIKDKYNKFDNKERELNEALKKKDKVIQDKDAEIASQSKKIEKLKKEIGAVNHELEKLQSHGEEGVVNRPAWGNFFSHCEKKYIFIVFGGFLLLVVILTLLAVNCHRSDKNEYLTGSDSSPVSVGSTAIALRTQWTRQSVPTITREQVDSIKVKYEFRIDIKNLISKRLTVGVPYALSLQARDNKDKKKSKVELKQIFTEQQQGVFKCDNEGVDISNDTLVAKKEGIITFFYMIGDEEIVRRTIKVKNR